MNNSRQSSPDPKMTDGVKLAVVVTPGNDDLVETPHDNDVLCGRGGSINSHVGNERFRELVEKRKRVYLTARFKREKRLIASSIVAEIRDLKPPGRFLTKDPKTGKWKDIGDEKARDKTSQALRENAPKVRAEIETEINQQRAEMKQTEAMEDVSVPESSNVPPSPYYQAWGVAPYRPIYGYGPPPSAPPPNYPPPGPYQPYEAYAQETQPSPHSSNHSHHSTSMHSTPQGSNVSHSMQTDEVQHQQAQPSPSHYHNERQSRNGQTRQDEGIKSTLDTLPSFVSSVPSSLAAWTKNSFSFGGSTDQHDEPPPPPANEPIAYVHRPESSNKRPPRVTFRDDYHRAHHGAHGYHRTSNSSRRSSSLFRNGYSSQRPRGHRSSTRPHPSQRPSKRPHVQTQHHHQQQQHQQQQQQQPDYNDDDDNVSLLSQVASHIMGSWETPIPCANGSSDDLQLTNYPHHDEGQEVELVEMMSFEDPIIEEEDDIREDEGSHSMQPPLDRRVEIDWPSRVGSCGSWLPEASSFFAVQDTPLSPSASMEMDQSAAYSCAGSIAGSLGGASLCQVFNNDQMIGGNNNVSGNAGPQQIDHRSLNQTTSWSQMSLGQIPSSSWDAGGPNTPQMDHKTLNQIPSWERSFRSNSPSTVCSRDDDLKSMGSGDLGSRISPVPISAMATSPRNSISQNMDMFESRMRE